MLWIVQGTIGTSRPATSRPAPASPGFQPRAIPTRIAARTTKAAPTKRYSGRSIAVRPNSSPGSSQARKRSCSRAQRKASTAAGRVKIAGGSLINAPVEWMNGG